MIWYDAVTLEPVAPGKCEDGGPPSISHRWCPTCKTERRLVQKLKAICCEECMTVILVMG